MDGSWIPPGLREWAFGSEGGGTERKEGRKEGRDLTSTSSKGERFCFSINLFTEETIRQLS